MFVFVSVSGLHKYVFKRHAAGPWRFSGDAITVSHVYNALTIVIGKFNLSPSCRESRRGLITY